jgi:N-acyl-D-aspartate/D-glutamate deacylase
MSAVAHALHCCVGDECESDEDEPNTMYSYGTTDAGAHNAIMQDSTASTHMLTHFVRDRTRGKKMPIEFAVRRQTKDTARLFGLNDRGTLEIGMRADLNVIDMVRYGLVNLRFSNPASSPICPLVHSGGCRALRATMSRWSMV